MRTAKPAERLEIGVLYGFRALMVLFVVNFHIWQQSWLPQYATLFGASVNFDFFTRSGYLFVDGMLLLSGFLLFLPYARQREEGTPVPDVKRFYRNRLVRILPSYLLSVLTLFFFVALKENAYRSAADMNKDLLTHLTFTFTFFRETYLYTPLNAGLWTIAVEMQFYLIFPLLARATQKKPALTLSLMALAGWAYRASVYYLAADTSTLINQMPAFLDVYALGMLGAMAYCRLRAFLSDADKRQRALVSAAGALAFVGSVAVLLALLRMQSVASVEGHEALRLSQLSIRLPLSLTLLVSMLAAAQMPRALRWLLDNRLMRFLSTISLNLYIWHQVLAVQMKRWFPDTLHGNLNLQYAYTLLCLCVGVVVAMACTYGLEQPAATLVNKALKGFGKRKEGIQHEGSTLTEAQQTADSLLLRPEEGRKGTD